MTTDWPHTHRPGFAAAGLIASQFPIEWAFWLDALTFLVSAACISFVHIAHTKGEDLTSVAVVVANLRSGIGTLVGTPVLRSILLTGIPVFFAFGLWNVLLLPFSITELGATEFEYGLQEGLTSVGFVVCVWPGFTGRASAHAASGTTWMLSGMPFHHMESAC